jgi:small subunit ribosomal protein S16
MLRIRLARQGSRKRPHYRIVVSDRVAGRGGNIVEVLGTYDPKRPEGVKLDGERAAFWLARGAHATDTVRSLIEKKSA